VRVLENVDPRVLDRAVVQRRPVPQVNTTNEKHDSDQRVAQEVDGAPNGAAQREWADDARAEDIGQTEEQRTHGLTNEEERRRDHRQEYVLEHVDAEQVRGDGLERRHEREQQGRDAEEEDTCSPDRPPPAVHPAHATRIYRRREDGGEDC